VQRRPKGYLVPLFVDKTFVQILSFSPCFVLPDGIRRAPTTDRHPPSDSGALPSTRLSERVETD